MNSAVLDASVAIKWYVPEVHSDEARKVLTALSKGLTLHAPDLIYPEFGNILWKKERLGELTRAEAAEIIAAFTAVPKTIHKSETLLPAALEIATLSGRTVYDSLYLALAAHLDTVVITADLKLYNALEKTRWGVLVGWIEMERFGAP